MLSQKIINCYIFKTVHTFSDTEVCVDQTENHFSLLSDKMHAITTNTFVIHTPQPAKHCFSDANTLLSKLIKAHSNQNDGKLSISAGIILKYHILAEYL